MTEIIQGVIHEITGAEQILLFGSRARGTAQPDSDYDVLAVVPNTLDRIERLRLA